MLSQKTYIKIIEKTQLVSVDIMFRYKNTTLLGLRCNQPAKGFLFTPGVRIYKNESIDNAIYRLCKTELGIDVKGTNLVANFEGAYNHYYENENFANEENISTQYINLAYSVFLTDDIYNKLNAALNDENNSKDNQHVGFMWVTLGDINNGIYNNLPIHKNVQEYFNIFPTIKIGNVLL